MALPINLYSVASNEYENSLTEDFRKDNGVYYTDVSLAEKMLSAIKHYIKTLTFSQKVVQKRVDISFIVKNKPCSFLEADGKCSIYGVRPLVCKDFPHTKKPERLFSLLSIIGFAEDCPVVFEIIERLKQIYNFR